ncbi:MAG: S-layer homology domain-containing protein [Oscillospiraceae bacterium]|nr:S-layer homology domain-containing protein [Oscillospiraceae bacterium]
MKKGRKLVSLMLAVLMFASLLPLSALAALGLPFTDVPRNAWYYPVVKTAYDRGITKGTTATTFEPNAAVTREMFLVMLFRAANVRLDLIHQAVSAMSDEDFAEIGLADVSKDAWYADAVYCAWGMEVTNGVDATHFGAGQPITREQMATMAERFMNVRLHVALKAAAHPAAAFSDADQVSDWAKNAVEAMRVAGVLQGDGQQRVNPKSHATRAEATAVILRLADATERVSFVPEGTAWIRVINDTGMNVPRPRQTDIKDPQTVQSMIRHLDNMPIDGETILPPSGGWTYELEFYDQQDQLLMICRFDSNFIIVNASVLSTVLPYFLPWTLMN